MTVVMILGIAAIFGGVVPGACRPRRVHQRGPRRLASRLLVMEAFSTAPDALKKELDPSFNERVLTPLLGRFVGIGRRLTPNDHAERIQRKLDVAGNPPGWTVDRIMSLKFVGFGVGLVAGALFAILFGLEPAARLHRRPRSAASSATTHRTSTSTSGARPHGEDAA